MTELVHLHVADGVGTLTLDSEHNRNALSKQLVTELTEHLATVEADDDVRVVLIRSAGRVFCSGADLAEAADGGMETGAKALLVGSYAARIIGWPIEKGQGLLQELLDWVTQPQFVYRHN